MRPPSAHRRSDNGRFQQAVSALIERLRDVVTSCQTPTQFRSKMSSFSKVFRHAGADCAKCAAQTVEKQWVARAVLPHNQAQSPPRLRITLRRTGEMKKGIRGGDAQSPRLTFRYRSTPGFVSCCGRHSRHPSEPSPLTLRCAPTSPLTRRGSYCVAASQLLASDRPPDAPRCPARCPAT